MNKCRVSMAVWVWVWLNLPVFMCVRPCACLCVRCLYAISIPYVSFHGNIAALGSHDPYAPLTHTHRHRHIYTTIVTLYDGSEYERLYGCVATSERNIHTCKLFQFGFVSTRMIIRTIVHNECECASVHESGTHLAYIHTPKSNCVV